MVKIQKKIVSKEYRDRKKTIVNPNYVGIKMRNKEFELINSLY
jgi:hypothetical protein